MLVSGNVSFVVPQPVQGTCANPTPNTLGVFPPFGVDCSAKKPKGTNGLGNESTQQAVANSINNKNVQVVEALSRQPNVKANAKAFAAVAAARARQGAWQGPDRGAGRRGVLTEASGLGFQLPVIVKRNAEVAQDVLAARAMKAWPYGWPGLTRASGLGDAIQDIPAPTVNYDPTAGLDPNSMYLGPPVSSSASGINWGSILTPITNATGTILTAQFGQPQLNPGEYIQTTPQGTVTYQQPVGVPVAAANVGLGTSGINIGDIMLLGGIALLAFVMMGKR